MTSPYHIAVTHRFADQMKALPLKHRKQLFKLVEALGMNPRPPGARKVDGMTGLYSETIEHFRILYKIEDQEILLLLIK